MRPAGDDQVSCPPCKTTDQPPGRHSHFGADHLEVLEGPSRYSALFFHTRSSTWASPRAALRSSTSSTKGSLGGVRTGPAAGRHSRGAGLQELPLPVPDRGLGDLRAASGPGDGQLTGQDGQHNTTFSGGPNSNCSNPRWCTVRAPVHQRVSLPNHGWWSVSNRYWIVS